MKNDMLMFPVLLVALLLPGISPGMDFSYGNYEQVLEQHVRPGAMINGINAAALDYPALARQASQPDSAYSRLLKELAAFDPGALESREEKMAFWINVYNIAAIKTIVDHYPVDGIRSRKVHWLGLPWNRKAITVGGKEYALAEIEFGMLVEGFKDLRAHFGINCASVSCVDLLPEPFRADGLDRQLEEQGKRFLANEQKGMRIDRKENKVYLSQVFKFDKKHFDAYAGGAMKFILPYVSEADREYLRSGKYDVEYLDYDWNANDTKNVKK
jgi:hypothetical protein